MPTYEYECAACGRGFEILQSMKDARLKKCPKCGKLKLHRLIGTGSGMIFKGTGFYETDYKKKDAPSTSSTPAKTESKPSSGGSHGCGSGCGCASN